MNFSRATLNLMNANDIPYDPVAMCPLLIQDLRALYALREYEEEVREKKEAAAVVEARAKAKRKPRLTAWVAIKSGLYITLFALILWTAVFMLVAGK